MNRRRVVITGLGVVAPNGIGKERFGAALLSGQSGIRKISAPSDPKPPCHVVARVTDFKLSTDLSPRSRNSGKSMSRGSAPTGIPDRAESGPEVPRNPCNSLGDDPTRPPRGFCRYCLSG